ncbi:MAG: phage holin family protein [Cytophagales bacterium]|nr:phage holin family protein [Bernardetiaceae bacterium]MDW8203485.1 phage holin family protein [Cytophagales bacterium]
MKTLIRIVLNGVFIFFLSQWLPGITVSSLEASFVVAIVLGILNALLAPILHLLALPVTILTLGLFALVVNGAIVLLADALMKSFAVSGWLMAIVFSIIMAVFNSFISRTLNTN